jgi:nucleotide-binding universal stress UspA family protein
MSSVVVVHSTDALGHLALDRAKMEARSRGVTLVLVAGVRMPIAEDQAEKYGKQRHDVEQSLESTIATARAEGLDAVGFFPPAPMDAAEAALEAARHHGAELIVVGLRRRTAVGKLILGSMSQDILLGAECDVLGVKLPEDAE